MRALTFRSAAWSGATILCLALLAGCGGDSGGSDDETPAPPDPTASAEETILGLALLPPGSTVTAAAALTAEDRPPGEAGAAETLGAGDMPPT